MTVFLIYQMRKGYDTVEEVWDSQEKADKRVDELLQKHPKADGFYSQAMGVKS